MALRKWWTCSFVLIFLASCILPATLWASEADSSNTFTMSISKQMPTREDTIEVVVDGHHLADVYAFEVNITYDPMKLTFLDAKSDAPGFTVPPIIQNTHIQLAHTRVGQGLGLEGEQRLYTLHFKAIQNGKTDLGLSSVKVVDSKLLSSTMQQTASVTLTIHDPFAFDDLDDYDWAVEAIEVLASQGIVNGTGDRQFSPGADLTRADFIVLLMRSLGLKGADGMSGLDGTPFDDVREGIYYAQPVAVARSMGIVQGDEENHFRPNATITREDMMVLTDRALRASKHLTTGSNLSDLSGFDDVPAISTYAVDSVASLVGIGLVHGYANGVHPQESTNRAQAAVLIYQLLKYIK